MTITKEKAEMIVLESLEAVSPGATKELDVELDLVKSGVLDSLDSMSFLFEIEERLGEKIAEIDEDYDDFTIPSIVKLVIER